MVGRVMTNKQIKLRQQIYQAQTCQALDKFFIRYLKSIWRGHFTRLQYDASSYPALCLEQPAKFTFDRKYLLTIASTKKQKRIPYDNVLDGWHDSCYTLAGLELSSADATHIHLTLRLDSHYPHIWRKWQQMQRLEKELE